MDDERTRLAVTGHPEQATFKACFVPHLHLPNSQATFGWLSLRRLTPGDRRSLVGLASLLLLFVVFRGNCSTGHGDCQIMAIAMACRLRCPHKMRTMH